jgi:hypothetical protein
LGWRLQDAQLGLERVLDGASILGREGVLGREAPVRPMQRLFFVRESGDFVL